jgi:hypothetical protein
VDDYCFINFIIKWYSFMPDNDNVVVVVVLFFISYSFRELKRDDLVVQPDTV